MDKQKKGEKPNESRVWSEEIMRKYVNYKKEDWDLFFLFSMVAAQMGPNEKKNQCPDHGSGTSDRHRPNIWKWADQRLDATLGTRSIRYIVTRRSGTS